MEIFWEGIFFVLKVSFWELENHLKLACKQLSFFFFFFPFQCSKTCGRGVRKREILCKSSSAGEGLPDSLCSGTPRPEAQEGCVLGRCPRNNRLQWAVSSWSEVWVQMYCWVWGLSLFNAQLTHQHPEAQSFYSTLMYRVPTVHLFLLISSSNVNTAPIALMGSGGRKTEVWYAECCDRVYTSMGELEVHPAWCWEESLSEETFQEVWAQRMSRSRAKVVPDRGCTPCRGENIALRMEQGCDGAGHY